MSNMKRPTADQCETNSEVALPNGYDSKYWKAYAYWYPQMGGYGSRAVVVVPIDDPNGCFEAYIWHSGEFPFTEDDGMPAHIHHCSADQFIQFGESVKRKMETKL